MRGALALLFVASSAFGADIAPNETHQQDLHLSAGTYVRVSVLQDRADVAVRAVGPRGVAIAEANTPASSQGKELLAWIAEETGTYRLEIVSLPSNLAPGRYTFAVEEQREATDLDRKRVAAERAFEAAEKLRGEGGAESMKAAIPKYEEAIALAKAANHDALAGDAHHYLGFVHDLLSDFPKAKEHYEHGLAIRRAIGDVRGEGYSLNNLAVVARLTGEPQKALELYELALAKRRESGDRWGEASTLNNLGTLHWSRGDYGRADDYYTQAIEIRREIEDRIGESETLLSLGAVRRVRGQTQEALAYYSRSLDLKRAIGDKRGTSLALHNLGAAHSTLGDFEKAMVFFNEAIELARATGDRVYESNSLTGAGTAQRHLGNTIKAIELYRAALELKRATGDKRGQAEALSNLGLTIETMGEPRSALNYYADALPLNREVGDRRGEAFTLSSIGSAYRALGDVAKAREHFDEALRIQREIGDKHGESETLLDLAALERDGGELAAARTHLEHALAVVESLRSSVPVQSLRASYVALKHDHYRLYVDVLMRLGEQEAALLASEQGRARSLRDLLNEARAGIRQGIDPELLKKRQELEQQLIAKERDRLRILGGKHTEAQRTAAVRAVETLLLDIREVEAQIRATNPRYASLMAPATPTLAELQSLLGDGTVLVEYSLGRTRSYAWIVTASELHAVTLAPAQEIERAARRWYELLSGPRKRELETPLRRASEEVAKLVIAPLAERLGAKRLLVVADGALQYIPFAALPVQGKPLVVTHEIAMLPSASLLALLSQERAAAPQDIAVLADPVLQPDDPRVRAGAPVQTAALRAGGAEFARLPYTRDEADAIVALAPRERTLKAVGFDASRETALDPKLRDYRIVHFATHGVVNTQRPELSGVVLSTIGRDGTARDGFLRLQDIYNLELNADLVVLSACRTALGREMKGEGLIGLSRGFMYAGAPRVVASLWDVRDAATAELMRRFYRGMLEEKRTPAEALRAAQLSFWKEGRPAFHWAAFVLQGR